MQAQLKLIVFAFFFFFLVFFASGTIDSQDGFLYLYQARSLYYQHNLLAPNPKDVANKKNLPTFMTRYDKEGKSRANIGLGFTLAYLPAVALTDIIYKIIQVAPPGNSFPLDSDWLIMLTASFTNCLIGAFFGTVFFQYLKLLGLKSKTAFFLTLVGFCSSNLLVYSKHSFAHLMFITLMLLSFYLLKRFFFDSKKQYLFWAGLAFGALIITYNQTFLLTIPAILVFYFLNQKGPATLKVFILDGLVFALGTLPFIIIYIFHQKLISGPAVTPALAADYQSRIFNLPLGVFFEGIWSQLFSPGRSLFLYSPLLIIPLIFWSKISRKVFPEMAVFLLLFFIYIPFYATIFVQYYSPGIGIEGLWHGENSWGPRYLLPLIPFGLLLTSYIFTKSAFKTKIFIFLPLALLGLYVELLGVIIPYQVKYYELQSEVNINQNRYFASSYINLFPRYSPVFMLSKRLIKNLRLIPQTLKHGFYQTRFIEGVYPTFNFFGKYVRQLDSKSVITLANSKSEDLNISLSFYNQTKKNKHHLKKIDPGTIVIYQSTFNSKPLAFLTINPDQEAAVYFRLNKKQTFPNKNILLLQIKTNQQPGITSYFYLSKLQINNEIVNLESLDLPYVSRIGQQATTYQTYNPNRLESWWRAWYMHSMAYERLPDLWWYRFLFYWDIPSTIIWLLFGLNFTGLLYSFWQLNSWWSGKKDS